MLRSFVSLIKADWRELIWFCLAVGLMAAYTVYAHATEVELSQSGYATYTYINDKAFQPSAHVVAENLNLTYGDFAVRTQLATREKVVRRVSVEYSLPLHGNNLLFQVGRLPRISSLMSDVYGNPDEWGMNILPLSTYSRRKVHDLTFNALDGYRVQWDHGTDNGNIRLAWINGRIPIEDKCKLQQELTSAATCNLKWDMTDGPNSYGLSAVVDYGNWRFLQSYDRQNYIEQLGTSPNNQARFIVSTLFPNIDYRLWRSGIAYSGLVGFIQAEHLENRVWSSPTHLASQAKDDYIMGGIKYGAIHYFAGYARGEAKGSSYASANVFTGATYRVDRWAYTLQYDNGYGSWQRLDRGPRSFAWESTSLSATYSW